MKGKYIAKFDVNDLAKKGDVVTLTQVGTDTVNFTTANGKNFVMDKKTFFANFTPQVNRNS